MSEEFDFLKKKDTPTPSEEENKAETKTTEDTSSANFDFLKKKDDAAEVKAAVVEESVKAKVVEEPMAEEPAVEQSAVEEVTVEEPVVEEPVVEEATVEEPVVEQPVVEESAEEPPKVEKNTKKEGKNKKGRKHKKMATYQQRQNKLGYAFMSPWILGFAIFTLFPFVATIYLSFTNVKSTALGYKIDFIGINNYISAFVKNTEFTKGLIQYLQMVIPYTFIIVVLSFIIAYLLNKIKTGKGILRTIYFLPVIIMSGPVMSQLLDVQNASTTAAEKIAEATTTTNEYSNIFIMQMIDSYSHGLANALAGIFDQLSIILWFTGIPIVLFINGLQKINVSIYEAAKIDSANSWQIMWKITVPMLKQIGMIITIFTVIQLGMYNSINPVYELIQKATGDTTGGLGYAATFSWIYSVIVLVIIGFVLLLFRDKKPKDIKDRQRQEKKLSKLEKQQKRRLRQQNRNVKKEAKKYGK